MKNLKNILIALGIIIAIAAVGIYFLPKQYSVSNSIVINKPVDVVYAQVSDFNTWGKWDPWAEKEPTAKASFEGAPGLKGEKMSWEGSIVGKGSMTLCWATANKTIHNADTIIKPYPGVSNDVWTFEADGNNTKITWTTSGGLPYPMARLAGLSFPKMISADEAHGLDNLKKYCEALPVPAPVASADSTGTMEAKSM